MEASVIAYIKSFGPLGAVLLVWFVTLVYDNRRWEKERKDQAVEREKERKERAAAAEAERIERAKQAEADRLERSKQAEEHMHKWDTMIRQHQDEIERLTKNHATETERAHKLLEREVQVSELHASLLQIISGKIDANAFCPRVRELTHQTSQGGGR